MSVIESLQQTLHSEVPLTRHMGLRVREYDGRSVVVSADFAANVNIHGTAFGGSLFSLCAVAGWALLHLKYQEWGVTALSVLGDASIHYARPVTDKIEARCTVPETQLLKPFSERVGRGERAAIDLVTLIDSAEREAARFQGRYSAYFD